MLSLYWLLIDCGVQHSWFDHSIYKCEKSTRGRVFMNFYFSIDCTGVPFAKHLCVTCKSKDCSANVTCYVFAGECTGSLELNTNLIDDKDENGKSCKRGSKDGNCTNIKLTHSSSIVYINSKTNHSSSIVYTKVK